MTTLSWLLLRQAENAEALPRRWSRRAWRRLKAVKPFARLHAHARANKKPATAIHAKGRQCARDFGGVLRRAGSLASFVRTLRHSFSEALVSRCCPLEQWYRNSSSRWGPCWLLCSGFTASSFLSRHWSRRTLRHGCQAGSSQLSPMDDALGPVTER